MALNLSLAQKDEVLYELQHLAIGVVIFPVLVRLVRAVSVLAVNRWVTGEKHEENGRKISRSAEGLYRHHLLCAILRVMIIVPVA